MKRLPEDLERYLAEIRELRALVRRLAKALYTHTRTDLAPDAALPQMRALVEELRPKKKRK